MRLSICAYAVAGLFIVANGAQAADGKALYDANCAACHNVLAPKIGDKAAWAPLIKKGNDALVQSVIAGKGMMPARGGHGTLTDADVKASTEYLVSKSK